MKLNPDCVRDILLAAEEVTDGKNLQVWDCGESYKDYSAEEFRYHVLQCKRYGYFIDGDFVGRTDNFRFTDISPRAHDFLADLRDNTIWQKTKKKAAEIGVSSLQILAQIAAAVVQAQLTNALGL